MSEHRIIVGECVEGMQGIGDQSVHCVVTSPPYWAMRNYGVDEQIGMEKTPEEYIDKLSRVFREVHRVLRNDGTLWLNLGDKIRDKNLLCIPWRVAMALQREGWYLRQDIIWSKPNPLPESVTDRCTKSHEFIFLLTKSPKYYFDHEAIREPAVTGKWDAMPKIGGTKHVGSGSNPSRTYSGNRPPGSGKRNKRSVWTVTPKPYRGAHFAVFPHDLIEPCILAGTSEKGCCPNCGSPLKRVVEKEKLTRERPNDRTTRHTQGNGVNSCGNTVAGVASRTVGWELTCRCTEHAKDDDGVTMCDLSPVPCTVLDPFVGSGTTIIVALQHGRNAIGCELNPEYANMAEERIAKELRPAPQTPRQQERSLMEQEHNASHEHELFNRTREVV